jgi:exonuclease SbcC
MKTSKITIRNLFGIKELELDGRSVEAVGNNGVGKTSIIDAIRYALTNNSERDYIIKNGETEGEILIETDTGLTINRKKRAEQSDYKSIKENGKDVPKPESFLQEIFTPIQLNPVEFTQMSRQEQNRIILDLIEFPWDLNWIREKFGEIPEGVNYEQNILQVLAEIQSEKGKYFQTRQDINRDMRNKRAFIEDIAKDIPQGFDFDKWNSFDLGEKYREIAKIKDDNNKIDRAKAFKQSYDNKLRGLQADRDIAISAEEKLIANERESLTNTIERLKAELKATEEKVAGLGEKLEDKKKVIESQYQEGLAKLNADIGIADEYANKAVVDVTGMQDEINIAEQMKGHLNEYTRMVEMQKDLEELTQKSQSLTDKIELARELPSEILKTATIPVAGLTVKDGIPLINDLPVSNLSEGEKLDLCVDIAISKPSTLQIILLDGTEKLSDQNRDRLYKKCKEKGLQFIATRTTNDNELEVTNL